MFESAGLVCWFYSLATNSIYDFEFSVNVLIRLRSCVSMDFSLLSCEGD